MKTKEHRKTAVRVQGTERLGLAAYDYPVGTDVKIVQYNLKGSFWDLQVQFPDGRILQVDSKELQ